MKWLIVIIILTLLAVSAGFRKFAAVFVLVCAIGGLIFWQYQEYDANQSKKRILPTALFFEDVSINSANGSYNIAGRITNNSDKYALKGVQLKLIFKDCVKDSNNNCLIISEENEYLYITIPPKQARDFKKKIYLYSDLNIKGKLVMSYSIEYAEAE